MQEASGHTSEKASKHTKEHTSTHKCSSSGEKRPSSKQQEYIITRKDLPLCCPMPDMTLWNAHPRVYLPIEAAGGSVTCPYCASVYILKESQ